MFCATIVIVGLSIFSSKDNIVRVDTSDWLSYSSQLGIEFKYPTDWELADSYSSSSVVLTKKGETFFTSLQPDKYGRDEYRPLNIYKTTTVSLEKRLQENTDKTWTTLECGDHKIMEMLHPPYMDLYYIEYPDSDDFLEIANFLNGMVSHNVITQETADEMNTVIEGIVCSISFLSPEELEQVNNNQTAIHQPSYSEPPTDQKEVEEADGWHGVTSDEKGFSLVVPAEWNLDFDKNAPAYFYTITPKDESISGKVRMGFRILPRSETYSFSTESYYGTDPVRTDHLLIAGKDTTVEIRDYDSRAAEPGGSDIPSRSGDLYFINETHSIYGYFNALQPDQESGLDVFESIISRLELRQYPEKEYEWKTITIDRLRLSVHYKDYLDTSRTSYMYMKFLGPVTADGENNWPYFEVTPVEYIVVPQGTNLKEYVADRVNKRFAPTLTLKNSPSPDDTEKIYSTIEWAEELQYTIAGEPTVHLHIPQSEYIDESDYFYVVNYNNLTEIKIVSAGGHKDWDLYKEFLDGISFDWKEGAD